MIKTEQKLGLSGEFQVIVRRADGSIKLDTGMQPNLVLDNGIKHYLGLPMKNNSGQTQGGHRNGFMNYCFVGTGNAEPQVTDVSLQHMVARNTTSRDTVSGEEEPDIGLHDGYVKVWKRSKYIFDTIINENITEVGLSPWYGTEYINTVRYNDAYVLVTRALIKDSGGTPIVVTVLEGEVLEVIYQINLYVDIRRKTGSFTLTTTKENQETTSTFDYFLQPYSIGYSNYIDNQLLYYDYYFGTTTWGVKETDDELTSAYDLNDVTYMSITHTDTTPLNEKVKDAIRTSHQNSNKYLENYFTVTETSSSFETGRRAFKGTAGIYAHIHENGIRAYRVSVGHSHHYILVNGLIVVKNRENGQGIKKTNRQMWEFDMSYTISRWSE